MNTDKRLRESAHEQRSAAPLAGFVEDCWYAILESRRLRRRPQSVTRLGRRLVLWRDRRGRVLATDARCPHRGADLGLGRVREGEIECPYHGFRFDGAGACTRIPCEGGDYSIPAGMAVNSYAVTERYGLIWLWWPAGGVCADPVAAESLPPVPWFDEMPASLSGTTTETMEWQTPFTRAAEGMLDIHHAPFAHRGVMPGVGPVLDPYTVEVEGDLIRSEGTLRKDTPEARQKKRGFRIGLHLRFPGLLLGTFGKRTRMVAAMTPVSEERTWIVFRYHVRMPVLGPLLAWLAALSELRLVQPDDQRMLEASTPEHLDTRDNRYVPADAGILQWHKLYRARMRAQGAHRRLPLAPASAQSRESRAPAQAVESRAPAQPREPSESHSPAAA
ncbi:aromatic ring-hydroxylating oxygenase subunit alpha [Haliangium ochraceum]|uniref:Rieske (2Fe-2S) iron-sulphur domain protein n=1 Tax=Haliangium ochraceum (strain DSM 14365 / JCM 11303 / SMP-2) TaxID=502025 RepID=D0LYU5_HALO1|nr:aromatic ring-hydroxylating dioxygenase subunit alpha [Haliangium ochraceum]ACY14415.1 Rieske (2Fe-2S) iron-sulphur domain protein [Haliangium ochraceum DSM 14365]